MGANESHGDENGDEKVQDDRDGKVGSVESGVVERKGDVGASSDTCMSVSRVSEFRMSV